MTYEEAEAILGSDPIEKALDFLEKNLTDEQMIGVLTGDFELYYTKRRWEMFFAE